VRLYDAVLDSAVHRDQNLQGINTGKKPAEGKRSISFSKAIAGEAVSSVLLGVEERFVVGLDEIPVNHSEEDREPYCKHMESNMLEYVERIHEGIRPGTSDEEVGRNQRGVPQAKIEVEDKIAVEATDALLDLLGVHDQDVDDGQD